MWPYFPAFFKSIELILSPFRFGHHRKSVTKSKSRKEQFYACHSHLVDFAFCFRYSVAFNGNVITTSYLFFEILIHLVCATPKQCLCLLKCVKPLYNKTKKNSKMCNQACVECRKLFATQVMTYSCSVKCVVTS